VCSGVGCGWNGSCTRGFVSCTVSFNELVANLPEQTAQRYCSRYANGRR